MIVFWSARISSACVELAQRRRAAADRRVEVLGVAGERGAELVDDQLQAALEGLAQRVLDEVGLHGLGRPLDRDVGLGRARVVVVAELVLGGDRVALRLAVDEVLGDQRLRLGRALGVLAELRQRARQLDRHDGALVGVDVEVRTVPAVDAGDPDLRARRRCRRRCRARSCRCASRRRPRSPRRRRRPRRARAWLSASGGASTGPAGTWEGSQSRVPPSVNGVELSPGLRSLAPGQRSRLPVSSALNSAGPCGLGVKPGTKLSGGGRPGDAGIAFGRLPGGANENVLSSTEKRPMPPLASTTPEEPKSSNQPTSSGV